MGKVVLNDSSLIAIGNAIRTKLGVNTTYKPGQMASAIGEISGYPEPIGTKSISANGSNIDVKDYASANVNVPNSYVASDEGKVVSSGALVTQGSLTITENDIYDTTLISELIANISGGGGSTLVTKNITQNGTYDPADDNADGYSEVTVSVSGGQYPFEMNFTQMEAQTINGVAISSSGATFDNMSDYIRLVDPRFFMDSNGVTIEIDVASMSLASGANRRFITSDTSSGLIYRSAGVWGFYSGNTWATDASFTGATDGDFFDNSTVKIYIDTSDYWHIYKDNTLVYEPDKSRAPSTFAIGASSNSINNAVITALRMYGGQPQITTE